MVRLVSMDGVSFEVKKNVAAVSLFLKERMEIFLDESVIPLPHINSKILGMVVRYCEQHVVAAARRKAAKATLTDKAVASEDIKRCYADLGKGEDIHCLFDLLMAAWDLEIDSLVLLTCQSVVNIMKKKTPEAIRVDFNIENDFPPEVEARFRMGFIWAFL
ncbi:hypothetical protein ACP275_14G123700 [Erythranthe tilingii]